MSRICGVEHQRVSNVFGAREVGEAWATRVEKLGSAISFFSLLLLLFFSQQCESHWHLLCFQFALDGLYLALACKKGKICIYCLLFYSLISHCLPSPPYMMIYPRIRTATVMSFWALNVLDFI